MIPGPHPVGINNSGDFGGARGAVCVGGTGTSVCVVLTPLGYSHSPGTKYNIKPGTQCIPNNMIPGIAAADVSTRNCA